MHQYSNYAYTSGVPRRQNVAAYSTRQSAAASHNQFMSGIVPSDDDGPQHDYLDGRDFVPTSSCRRLTPGGAVSCLPRSSGELMPPPPPTFLCPPRPNPTSETSSLRNQFVGGALHSSPFERVAVHIDADENDVSASGQQQQHARSHSAPAAPRRRNAIDHQATAQHSCASPQTPWLLPTVHPGEENTDANRRLLSSPVSSPGPPSAATSIPHNSTTNVCHRRTFPLSDSELNGPVVESCDIDAIRRRPNSVSLPAINGNSSCCSDPLLTRRRLRATRSRPNLYSAGYYRLGSTLAGMAVVAGVALVISAVAVQLLLRLSTSWRSAGTDVDGMTSAPAEAETDDSFLSKSGGSGRGLTPTNAVVQEVAVALAAVTVALDLCCLLTISMQCFFAVKLASSCHNGKLSMSNYLEKSSASRTVTSAGLFLSVPIFLLALTLYAVLEYRFTSAITCVVIFTLAIVCSTIVSAHNIYCWNIENEKSRENNSAQSIIKLPSAVLPRDASKQTLNSDDSTATQLKLSTLV